MRSPMMLASVLAFLVAPELTAQTTLVIPDGKSLATVEGNSNSLTPGNPAVARVQFFYAKGVVGGAPRSIVGLKLRPDGLYTQYRPWPAFTALSFEVYLAEHPGPSHIDRFSHAGNHTASYKQVVLARAVSYPLAPLPTSAPDTFSVDLKFDTAFVYTAREGLLVEMARDDQTKSYYRWYMDAWNDGAHPGTPEGTFTSFGSGCPAAFAVTCAKVTVNGNVKDPAAPSPGQTFWTEGACQQSQVPVLGIIGIELTPPIDLGPFGAPGCSLYTSLIWTTVAISDNAPTGDFKLSWGKIPYMPAFAGVLLCHQAVGFHPSYNTLGFGMSQGLKITLGGGFHRDLEVGTVYGNYYSAFPNYALTDDVPQFSATKAAVFELY